MTRFMMTMVALSCFFSGALAENIFHPHLAFARASAKVYSIPVTDPAYSAIYTDRKGCVVRVDSDFVSVTADSLSDNKTRTTGWQTASVARRKATSFGGKELQAGQVEYSGVEYNLLLTSDLINRQCAPMLKALPDTAVRRLAAKVIIE